MSRATAVLVLALWTGNLLPALDATMVGTALPTIVGQLGGLDLYGWVFAAYLLTFTTSVPVFGKLSGLYGRKPIFVGGVGVYLLASVLSGLVQNVEQLILCRALAGVGLGAVMPMIITILGDAFPLEQRAKLQWVFASAWFFSSLVGPALGSFVTIFATWRLVFYLIAPVGLLPVTLLIRYYHEDMERSEHSIDVGGALFLAVGVVALLLALSPGNRGASVGLQTSAVLVMVAVVFLTLFIWNERRVREPLLPIPLLLTRVIGVSVLGSFFFGAAQFGVTAFLPLFAQGAQGGTAANAGAVLAPLTLGWPIGAGYGGRLLLRIGFRNSVLLGTGLVVFSQVGFLLLDRSTPLPLIMAAMFFMGLGFGFSNVAFMFAVQESVTWSERGIAVASLQFARSVGGSIGVALMGALVTWQMAPFLSDQALAASGGVTGALLDPATRAALAPAVLLELQQSLAEALHGVFIIIGIVALACLACAVAFPSVIHSKRTDETPEAEPVTSAPVKKPLL